MSQSLTKRLWQMLGDLVEEHGEQMAELKEKYGAGEVAMSVSADSKKHGHKFKITFTVDPDVEDDDAERSDG